VVTPSFLSELGLARHYRQPWRSRVGVFVDGLLAVSLEPVRSPAEMRALPEGDRATLRRAVVAATGCERQWRLLYGSHLTADERLFAVMYWRWHQRQRTRKRSRPESEGFSHAFRQGVASDVLKRLGLAESVRTASAAELALGVAGSKFNFAELASPGAFGVVNALETHAAFSRDIAKYFESPLTSAMANLDGMTSVARTVESVRALSQSVAFTGANPANILRAAKVGLPGLDTSVSHLLNGKPFVHMTKFAVPEKLMAWTVPSGFAQMVAHWEQTSGMTAAALEGLRVKVPSVALLASTHIGAAVEAFQRIERLGEPMRELTEAVELVDQFDRRWQNEALYFIVSGFLAVCGLWEMRKLASLSREEVEEAVLLALEGVVGDGQFIPALRGEVARAPYLNSSQRTNLDHAVEHAAKREYVEACASLYWGLEGAFWEVGYATSVVTLQRTDPRKTSRSVGFETMVKRLRLGPELKTFMVRGLYGTTGNPYRHGGADSGERRQVLLGISALAGWFEEFTSTQALTELVTRTGNILPGAVDRVLESPRLLGP